MGEQNGVTLEESGKTSKVLIMIVPFEKEHLMLKE